MKSTLIKKTKQNKKPSPFCLSLKLDVPSMKYVPLYLSAMLFTACLELTLFITEILTLFSTFICCSVHPSVLIFTDGCDLLSLLNITFLTCDILNLLYFFQPCA